MVDCYNFTGGVGLDEACSDWLGERKIELPSKNFPKEPASALERQYAMKDAELTWKLGKALT